MKYWLLGVACVLSAAAVLTLRELDPPAARILLFALYIVPSLACIVTAFAYGAHDRLRWAWLSVGAGYAVAFASKAFVGDSNDELASMSAAHVAVWAACIVAFNLGTTTGLILFARVWSGTGMIPPWRRWATAGFFVLAMLLGYGNLVRALKLLMPPTAVGIGAFASVGGDIISITLIGPIFATMIALRGGVLARPWIFLFISVFFWLLDNLAPVTAHGVGIVIDGIVRPIAITSGAAAAVAQLWVKREVRAGFVE
jgi:hypothetical protein